VVVALLTAIGVTACGSPAPTPPPNTLTTPRPGATPSATPAGEFSKEAANPDPAYDTGFTIQITNSGFHPQWLIAPCCQAITWKNMTSAPVTVAFDHVVGGSGQPVQPGGEYVFAPPNVESITYHSAQTPSVKGRIQVNQLPQ
jgi:hypothetical protein